MNLLHAAIAAGKPWARERGLNYLRNAHRLDFEASGVLLLAKSKAMLVALANLFGAEQPVRTYLALLPGTPPQPTWEVEAPLALHPTRPGLVRVDPKRGKKARTQFAVRELFAGYALVQCRPLTSRSQQIRAHLQHWGLPICGDSSYGGSPLLLSKLKSDYRLKPGRTERPLLATTALHAERLELPHPVTGQQVVITADWPKDLTVAVKYLRRYAPLS
jgi:23S rRNA-/tRNA-specific pseudouridylate synthase